MPCQCFRVAFNATNSRPASGAGHAGSSAAHEASVTVAPALGTIIAEPIPSAVPASHGLLGVGIGGNVRTSVAPLPFPALVLAAPYRSPLSA